MAVSIADFSKYFAAQKSGTYKCVFCANEQFIANAVSLPSASDGSPSLAALLIVPTVANREDTSFAGNHTFYSISCTKCGRSDFFHSNQVEGWVSEQEKTEAKDG